MSDRRLREMGIDPDGDPGEIMREIKRRFDAMKKEAEADKPVIVDMSAHDALQKKCPRSW